MLRFSVTTFSVVRGQCLEDTDLEFLAPNVSNIFLTFAEVRQSQEKMWKVVLPVLENASEFPFQMGSPEAASVEVRQDKSGHSVHFSVV